MIVFALLSFYVLGEPSTNLGTSVQGPTVRKSISVNIVCTEWGRRIRYLREKQSYSQAACLAWVAWLLLSFSPFPVSSPVAPPGMHPQ